MIFVTKNREELPVLSGYVNSKWERELPNGKTVTCYRVGTREKLRDGSKRYSSWVCEMIGKARELVEREGLEVGDRIAVYSLKMTNISKKNEDGSWGREYLNIFINDMDIDERASAAPGESDGGDLAY